MTPIVLAAREKPRMNGGREDALEARGPYHVLRYLSWQHRAVLLEAKGMSGSAGTHCGVIGILFTATYVMSEWQSIETRGEFVTAVDSRGSLWTGDDVQKHPSITPAGLPCQAILSIRIASISEPPTVVLEATSPVAACSWL